VFILCRCSQIRAKKIKNIKNIKNYKKRFYKKYRAYNTKNNNLLKKFAFYNNNFDNKKNIDKEFATLFKENINKILNNK